MSSSAPPPLSTLSQRLTTASTLILERSRVVSTLKLPASASTDAQIVRALTFVRDGLKRVQGGGGDDEEVKELGSRYDRLVEMMEEQDEIGRLKVRDLKRPREVIEESRPPPSLGNTSETSSIQQETTTTPFRDSPSPDPLAQPRSGMSSRSSDTQRQIRPAGGSRYKDAPFVVGVDDEDGGTEDVSDHDILGNQRVMMEDQDARLNVLSDSIQKQSHLSLAIGSELDLHHELLEETDDALDRTGDRMRRARRNLDKVSRGAKEHGSAITIVVLIVVLLLLIIVFKT